MTRSTVAALLLTILFWLGLIALSGAEKGLLVFETMSKQGVTLSDVSNQQQGLESKAKGSSGHDGGDKARSQKEKNARWLSRTHDIVFAIKTVLPKTDETVGLLKRWLLDSADLEDQPGDSRNQKARNVDKELNETFRSRSVAWIVGTSLGFELIVLSLAAFLFCRRDY